MKNLREKRMCLLASFIWVKQSKSYKRHCEQTCLNATWRTNEWLATGQLNTQVREKRFNSRNSCKTKVIERERTNLNLKIKTCFKETPFLIVTLAPVSPLLFIFMYSLAFQQISFSKQTEQKYIFDSLVWFVIAVGALRIRSQIGKPQSGRKWLRRKIRKGRADGR